MKTLTRWFLDNPVAANLLMAFILVSGLLTLGDLRVETFPQIPPSRLIIATTYPGATARQVEQGVTQRIEEAISGVPGIRSIVSESRRGESLVYVRKNTDAKLDRLIEDIRNQVETIVGFPEQAERPRIHRDEFTNLAAFVLVYGGADDDLLQQVASRAQQALKRHPGISQVTHLGKRSRELVVEPNLEHLKRHGLSTETLAERIQQWSLDYRAGTLKTARGTILLRGDSHADNLRRLQNLPVISSSGAIVRLGELAEIRRGFQQTDSLVRFQGEPAIALMVSTSQKDNLLTVSQAVQETLNELRPSLPATVALDVMADMAPYIRDQIRLLTGNAWQGLLIVLVVLGLFLELRLAFWVAMGIPVALAGAIALMGLPMLDYSINDITLFGMILVLGVLVDDAVVVGESIHGERQRIADPRQAAWAGVESVSVATVYGVLTTIAAFSPMLWIENELAKVLAGFSAVVIFALFFSLIESKLILPTHLAFARREPSGDRGRLLSSLERVKQVCGNALEWFTSRIYRPLLAAALRRRGATLLWFLGAVLLAYGLLAKGHIRSVFFPEIPGRYATAAISMDQQAPFELTQRTAARLEQALVAAGLSLGQDYGLPASAIAQYVVSLDERGEIELNAALSDAALARIPPQQVISAWRTRAGELEGGYAAEFRLADEPAGATAISIATASRDLSKHIADILKPALLALPGVGSVHDDSQSGRRQLRITLNDRGAQLGIDQRRLATLVGGAFGEIEVQRLIEQGEETKLLVRLPEHNKRTIQQLEETEVLVAEDRYVSLEQIADIAFTREPEVVHRRDRNEVVHLYWRQDKRVAAPEAIWKTLSETIIPQLQATYPNVRIKAVGELDEITEVQAGFRKAMLLTILLIYVLLAVPLRSYWQPLVIMSVIPFGFAGAIYGHGLMDLPVSLLSLFGMMAMTGVVINDSLVLMTRVNQLKEAGLNRTAALLEAGHSRMRAIFLTTLTTVCGLLPLLSETSEQAQYLKPAAVSLVFGELFATPITLILVPVLLSFGGSRQAKRAPRQNLKTVSEGKPRETP